MQSTCRLICVWVSNEIRICEVPDFDVVVSIAYSSIFGPVQRTIDLTHEPMQLPVLQRSPCC